MLYLLGANGRFGCYYVDMADITFSKDCGNSPKAGIVKDLNAAFAKNDINKILSYFAEDIEWVMVGTDTTKGHEQVEKMLLSMDDDDLIELNLETVITHGAFACGKGSLKTKNNKIYSFCDFYNFSSNAKDAKIKKLESYIIEARA